jgi:hypothetical protein
MLYYNKIMTKILAKNKIFFSEKRSLPLTWEKAAGMWKK